MREVRKYRYVFAAVLTLLVFGMGMMFNSFMDDARASAVKEELQDNLIEMESMQTQLTYLQTGKKSCGALNAGLNNIVKGYNERLGRVQRYQENSMFGQEDFQDIRHRYVLAGIRYWMFAQELRERCDYRPNTVLFFTSTLDKEDCAACRRQGEQLSLLKKIHGEKLLVFSIPMRLEDGLIDILEERYNVTEPPALVINGDKKLSGYHPRSEIEKYLEFNRSR